MQALWGEGRVAGASVVLLPSNKRRSPIGNRPQVSTRTPPKLSGIWPLYAANGPLDAETMQKNNRQP
jgi:hypothetical protein